MEHSKESDADVRHHAGVLETDIDAVDIDDGPHETSARFGITDLDSVKSKVYLLYYLVKTRFCVADFVV